MDASIIGVDPFAVGRPGRDALSLFLSLMESPCVFVCTKSKSNDTAWSSLFFSFLFFSFRFFYFSLFI